MQENKIEALVIVTHDRAWLIVLLMKKQSVVRYTVEPTNAHRFKQEGCGNVDTIDKLCSTHNSGELKLR